MGAMMIQNYDVDTPRVSNLRRAPNQIGTLREPEQHSQSTWIGTLRELKQVLPAIAVPDTPPAASTAFPPVSGGFCSSNLLCILRLPLNLGGFAV